MTKVEKFLRDEGGDELWISFIRNFYDHPGDVQHEYTEIDDYLNDGGNSEHSINYAFEWNLTPEGEEYWMHLFDKYSAYFHNNKNQCP